MDTTQTLSELSRLLEEAKDERLWGSIQLDFQDGEPVLIRRTETRKIQHPAGMRNNHHERNQSR
jgi:hypothetical protein